jgi:serine/threonine-protein kinase HipA
MRKALVKMHDVKAGILSEENRDSYIFQYEKDYQGPSISLTIPVKPEPYIFEKFPPFFEGLLPEGIQLEGLLKIQKVDREDYFKQLIITGADLVGAVTVSAIQETDE